MALSVSFLCLSTSSACFIWQLDWSVQAALLTPFLLVAGVPYKYYSIVCLCGPVAGLIVQPVMG